MRLVKSAFQALNSQGNLSHSGREYDGYNGLRCVGKAMIICTVLVCLFFSRRSKDQVNRIAESLDDV